LSTSHQFADRLAVTEDGDRPTCAVLKLVPVVHAEVAVDGRQQVARFERRSYGPTAAEFFFKKK
jgi:hypothetical protein